MKQLLIFILFTSSLKSQVAVEYYTANKNEVNKIAKLISISDVKKKNGEYIVYGYSPVENIFKVNKLQDNAKPSRTKYFTKRNLAKIIKQTIEVCQSDNRIAPPIAANVYRIVGSCIEKYKTYDKCSQAVFVSLNYVFRNGTDRTKNKVYKILNKKSYVTLDDVLRLKIVDSSDVVDYNSITTEYYSNNNTIFSWSKYHKLGVLPYFGERNLDIIDNEFKSYLKTKYIPAVDKEDFLYIKTLRDNLTSEQKQIAWFYNDLPGFEGGPPSHDMSILSDIQFYSGMKKADYKSAIIFSTKAIYNAFVLCWYLKYQFNTARPSDVITGFTPLLIRNPMFPGYPSGHSIQSSAFAWTLINLGFDRKIYDKDIVNGKEVVYEYNSLDQYAERASISRVYGGIHIVKDCEAGYSIGKELANELVNK